MVVAPLQCTTPWPGRQDSAALTSAMAPSKVVMKTQSAASTAACCASP